MCRFLHCTVDAAQAAAGDHSSAYIPIATSAALIAARIAAGVCCCPTTPNTAMLAQLQLQPAPWRCPSRSRLVCQAGKPKQAQHKPQRPSERSPSGADLDALLSAAGLADERVAPFHKEFAAAVKASGLGLTNEQAAAVQEKADAAYLAARSMPASKEAMFGDDFEAAVGTQNLLMRLGYRGQDDEFIEAYSSLPPGSVFLKEASLPYDPFSEEFQSFGNTPCEGVHLLPGSTHVAVGFADLGELAAAVSRWGQTDAGQLAAFPLEFDEGRPDAAGVQADMAAYSLQLERLAAGQEADRAPHDQRATEASASHALLQVMQCVQQASTGRAAAPAAAAAAAGGGSNNGNDVGSDGSSAQPRPLLWVGYDASPYAVAKAAVLLEMMAGGADTDAVLQVWYSSCWSHSTQEAFQAALQAVLDSSSSRSEDGTAQQPQFSDRVLQLLQHWQQHPGVSLEQSRSSWIARVDHDQSQAPVGGFTREQDRLALLRYLCTGELLTADVGSTVMCSLPEGFGTLASNENFFTTFRPSTLMRAWRLQQYPDIVAAGVSALRRRLARLAELIRQGQVVAEVRHAAVTSSNAAVLSEIQLLQPLSISWSNVPDYLEAEEFHLMAQQCSARASVHFLHCMNYVREMKGAIWVDWIMDRLAALQNGLQGEADAIKEFVRGSLERSDAEIASSYAALGVDKLLLPHPTVDNPRNVLDIMLQSRMYSEWLGAFMVWAEEVASETTSPSILRIAAAVQRSMPPAPGQDPEAESLVPEDDGLTLCLVLSAPSYGPLQRTCATIDVAFVQYSDGVLG